MQDAARDYDDRILKAATGLEGGCVASGETCGVVSGGALAIALLHLKAAENGAQVTPEMMIRDAGSFVQWFERSFGTTVCRKRTGVNFNTVRGQMRYFFSLPKILRCFNHTGRSINYLTFDFGSHESQSECPRPPGGENEGIHCAGAVLARVREHTGIGYARLEKIACVFDGGVGMSGGLCGALAGGIMAMNLVHGFDLRNMGYGKNFGAFVRGHVNLLTETSVGPPDTFYRGKQLLEKFRARAGALSCYGITRRKFCDTNDFQSFMATGNGCGQLIESAAELAIALMEEK